MVHPELAIFFFVSCGFRFVRLVIRKSNQAFVSQFVWRRPSIPTHHLPIHPSIRLVFFLPPQRADLTYACLCL